MSDHSAVPYPRTSVPDAEIQRVADAMRAKPEYFDEQYIADRYRGFGLTVLPDPFSKDVVVPIVSALENGLPLSVVRLGDGETDILTLDAYAGTPNLDRHAFAATAVKHYVPAISEASLQEIGSLFGRDHSTVSYAVDAVERRTLAKPTLRYQLEEIATRLGLS